MAKWPPSLRRRNYPSAPHLAGDLDHHAQLRPLLLLGEHVALFGGSKAALRRETELIEGGEFGRLLDAALDVVLLFQLAGFCRDQPEHDNLVAFGQKAQRLKAAGARAVVFEEISVVVQLPEQNFGDRLVAAFGNPGRAEIAAADVRGDRDVGRLAFQRAVDDAGVVLGQTIGVKPAFARFFQLRLRAQIGPGGVVDLQIATTGIVETADGLAIRLRQIVEDGVAVGVFLGGDRIRLEAKMHGRRGRDAHFRRDVRMRLEKLEMLQHRMAAGEAELAGDARAQMLGLHAVKLDAVIDLMDLDAVEHAVEIEMPPRAAEFAVGGALEADLLLLLDDLLDLAVLDLLELRSRDRALLALGAGFLERRGAQNRADHIGAVRRLVFGHRAILLKNCWRDTSGGRAFRQLLKAGRQLEGMMGRSPIALPVIIREGG